MEPPWSLSVLSLVLKLTVAPPCLNKGNRLLLRSSFLFLPQPDLYLTLGGLGNLVSPQPPGKGEGLEVELNTSGQWFKWASLGHEASIKTPKARLWSVSRLMNLWTCWRVVYSQSLEAPYCFHTPCPKYLFPLTVLEICPFIINQ